MVPSSLFCPKCGGLNEPGAAVCFACGESMQAPSPSSKSTTSINVPLITTKLLQGRYRLVAQIGEGGFGAVYKGEDLRLGNRLVAVKEMKPSGLKPLELKEATDAFQREAMLLTGLKHPSLPAIHDQFTEDGQWYLVMDFIQGRTLESYLAKAPKGRLPVREAFNIALQLCNVLDYLHSQQPPIIFRDLKPSNIMLTPEGQVYLIDFGIARHFKPGQSKDTVAFGTTGYAAPEQYGKAQTTPRSDVYSLGAVMHHMLTGDDPANTPFKFAPLLMPRPTGTWTFLRQMLEIDEFKRPADMRIVRHTFQRLADTWEAERRNGQPTSALPAYQAATGFLPAVRPGQTTQAPLLANASTQAPPQIYPAQATPGQTPRRPRKIQPIYIIAAVLVIAIVIALIAAISSTGTSPQPGNYYNHNGGSTTTIYTPPDTPTAAPNGLGPGILAVAWSPDGKRVASAGMDQMVHMWDLASGTALFTYMGHTALIDALAWQPRGNLIASGGLDTTVQVWDVTTGKPVYTYRGHSNRISNIVWSPDGKRIASASDDDTVQVWDATTGQHLLTFTAPATTGTNQIWAVAWSPDGKYLAVGNGNGLVQVLDATNGNVFYVYGESQGIESLAWSPDSKRIASASADGTVQVWNALDGGNVLHYDGHDGRIVEAVAWSPDGKYLASGGDDDTVQVWDATTDNSVYTFSRHKDAVLSVAWSPDGTQIASSSKDGTLQIWDALTGSPDMILPPQA